MRPLGAQRGSRHSGEFGCCCFFFLPSVNCVSVARGRCSAPHAVILRVCEALALGTDSPTTQHVCGYHSCGENLGEKQGCSAKTGGRQSRDNSDSLWGFNSGVTTRASRSAEGLGLDSPLFGEGGFSLLAVASQLLKNPAFLTQRIL